MDQMKMSIKKSRELHREGRGKEDNKATEGLGVMSAAIGKDPERNFKGIINSSHLTDAPEWGCERTATVQANSS